MLILLFIMLILSVYIYLVRKKIKELSVSAVSTMT